MRAASSLIALGWSPDGVYSEMTSNGATALLAVVEAATTVSVDVGVSAGTLD
jgi:hypothetical protein